MHKDKLRRGMTVLVLSPSRYAGHCGQIVETGDNLLLAFEDGNSDWIEVGQLMLWAFRDSRWVWVGIEGVEREAWEYE